MEHEVDSDDEQDNNGGYGAARRATNQTCRRARASVNSLFYFDHGDFGHGCAALGFASLPRLVCPLSVEEAQDTSMRFGLSILGCEKRGEW